MQLPRGEHPKPQFERAHWMNLNGPWQFAVDPGRSGVPRGYAADDVVFEQEILVPFCPQSRLSGLQHLDFLYGVWYGRSVTLTEEQCRGRVVLHFGAVDYAAAVFCNGTEVGAHKGGYVSFSFDITEFVHPGENILKVFAEDDERSRLIPTGKQSDRYESYNCDYTRTTGIWQTVWLEFTPHTYIASARYYPDAANAVLRIQAELCGSAELTAVAVYEGREVGRASIQAAGGIRELSIPLSERHLWEVGHGRLYDLKLTYGDDAVSSYFGLRSLRLDGYRFLLNEKTVFQRLILDQGFYPDGIYTAPTDQALAEDISLSMAAGFNGARLHQKIFEERYLYHCDRMGYLVWGEFPSWGLDHSYADCIYGILPEFLEELNRDFNHPAIVGWCPFNETWDVDGRKQFDEALRVLYRVTKQVDPTRPCIDSSGNYHVETDIFDVHDYEQNPAVFKEHYDQIMKTGILYDRFPDRQHYQKGQPNFVSEYGGILWRDDDSGWGYGESVQTKEEFMDRFRGLTDALLDNPCMLGLCYTQLTDVEQEQNGLYRYDRTPKFDVQTLHDIVTRQAAIEAE